MIGLTIDELTVGQSAAFTKTVSESDVYLFGGVTGDFNPAHINETYAAGTHLRRALLTECFWVDLFQTCWEICSRAGNDLYQTER